MRKGYLVFKLNTDVNLPPRQQFHKKHIGNLNYTVNKQRAQFERTLKTLLKQQKQKKIIIDEIIEQDNIKAIRYTVLWKRIEIKS